MKTRQTIGCPFGLCLRLLIGLTATQSVAAQDHQATRSDLRSSIQRAIEPLESSMVVYRQQRRCFSCHHHAHPSVALTEMARRGFKVNEENLKTQIRRSIEQTNGVLNRYVDGLSIGGGVDTAGHAIWTMQIANHQPDELSSAIVDWMLARDGNSGFWTGTHTRPPTQASNLTRTWLCLQAFRQFGTSEQSKEIEERIQVARQWLLKVDAKTTEDKVARMRALHAIGNTDMQLAEFASDLIEDQQPDGGWRQEPELPSDAYATGSVLMALYQIGGMPATDPVYQRGVEFLKSTQLPDGTWHVKTRSQPVQEYFESGFPHGKDQFISFTATCWAATAMALTFPETEEAR